jgi:hypothetical protein
MSSAGELRWEFLQGARGGWDDRSNRGQRFTDVVELPERQTLLCGVKKTSNVYSIVLSRLGIDGGVVDERVIQPNDGQGSTVNLRCARWGRGIALFSSITGRPGAAWMGYLNDQLDTERQKFGDQFGEKRGAVGQFNYGNRDSGKGHGAKQQVLAATANYSIGSTPALIR